MILGLLFTLFSLSRSAMISVLGTDRPEEVFPPISFTFRMGDFPRIYRHYESNAWGGLVVVLCSLLYFRRYAYQCLDQPFQWKLAGPELVTRLTSGARPEYHADQSRVESRIYWAEHGAKFSRQHERGLDQRVLTTRFIQRAAIELCRLRHATPGGGNHG